MSKTVNLGGDRIGSGNKMTVAMHGFERSNHNQDYAFRTSMSVGTLVPFLVEIGLPGTSFDIELEADVLTLPTLGPLFGSMKVQLDVYQCPIRLYQAKLHNNKLDIGLNMADIKLPQVVLTGARPFESESIPLEYQQINQSCLLAYLGSRGAGQSKMSYKEWNDEVIVAHNAIPLLAYWDIFKNYYANKQEEKAFVIHGEPGAQGTWDSTSVYPGGQSSISPDQFIDFMNTPQQFITITGRGLIAEGLEIEVAQDVGGGGRTWQKASDRAQVVEQVDENTIRLWGLLPWGLLQFVGPARNAQETIFFEKNAVKLKEFDLKNLDEMREDILEAVKQSSPFMIDRESRPPYSLMLQKVSDNPATPYMSAIYQQEGLAVKTYQSDIFNNWLNQEWIDGDNGINAISAIDVSEGSFTIDALNLANKVYNMLNRIAVSGGSYDDYLEAVYDHKAYRKAETPMYEGGLIKELGFQEVVSNASAEGEPLGTLAGRGRMMDRRKGGRIKIKCEEPSYIIGIVSITPRVDYSQGNDWKTKITNMSEWHVPSLDQIGFQDLLTDQMAYWDTGRTAITNAPFYRSAGKQPAWINYMTNFSKTYGNFAHPNREMFMTLNRRYEAFDRGGGSGQYVPGIKDLTTYIDPEKYNYMFAQTSLDAMNYWMNIGVKMTSRRKMSAKQIPNL